MLAVGHRNRTEVLARRPRQVHVPLGDHRHLRGRRGQPVRIRERVVDAGRVRIFHQSQLHLAEPLAGPLVESTVCHNAIRDTGRHRNSGLLDGRARRAAAVVDLGEELQLSDTRGPRNRDLGIGIHRERHHAVDIGRRQTRVVERVQNGLGREPQLAAAGVLRKIGGADPNDGRLP